MSHTWSKSALALHELGLAASFGGLLFAKTGLDPAVKVIPDERDRGRVLNAATAAYTIPGSIALAGAALAWLIGRSAARLRTDVTGTAPGPSTSTRRSVSSSEASCPRTGSRGVWCPIAPAFSTQQPDRYIIRAKGQPCRDCRSCFW